MSANRYLAWALLLWAMPACTTTIPATTKAAQVERMQCEPASTESATIRLLQDTVVLKAEPVYSHIITGRNDCEERVAGAKLLIRPPEGVSAEQMTRLLQCHSARVLLGQIDRSALEDDPFSLPDAWIAINVVPEQGNYLVHLEANDVPGNLALAARARAFANAHAWPSLASGPL